MIADIGLFLLIAFVMLAQYAPATTANTVWTLLCGILGLGLFMAGIVTLLMERVL